jgi:RimJ/RimL family protein N-acetyltransferase/sugar phosphate isomerase/epimerase
MIMQIGLKLGSKDKMYTQDILSLYKQNYFQYIELFAVPESFDDTIGYWKQFAVPFVIHAPHSFVGMNLSLKEQRNSNRKKLQETFQFADSLYAEYIIFHSGVDGDIEETINQLRPFVDSRCLIENKPVKGLNNEKCIGSTVEEITYIMNELQMGFCFDFGHAICAANSLKKEIFVLIQKFMALNPAMYHLTDGNYTSEYDSHLHYGKGTFPVKELLKLVPNMAKLTNEAKHNSKMNLDDFIKDSLYCMRNIYLRKIAYSDMDIIYKWANDRETRANAFSTDPIPYDVHKEWFQKKLNSDNVLFFIYHHGEKSIGQIRLDIKDNKAIIDYTIDPLMRKKGYGYKMMLLMENKIKNEFPAIKTLIGEVKHNNIASQRVFKKLNYKEDCHKDYMCFSKSL